MKNDSRNISQLISYNEIYQLMLFLDLSEKNNIQNFLAINKHLPMLWITEHILLNTGTYRNIDTFFTFAYDSSTAIFFHALKKHGLKKKDFSIYNIRTYNNHANKDYLEFFRNEINQLPFDNRFKIRMLWKYITEKIKKKPILKVDKDFLQDECKNEGCEMNPIFLFYLIMKWQCTDYIPFFIPIDLNTSCATEKTNSLYFVKKAILDEFDLLNFLKIIQSFQSLKDYQNRIDLHELISISSFWKTGKPSCKEDIFTIVSIIIHNDLYVNQNI